MHKVILTIYWVGVGTAAVMRAYVFEFATSTAALKAVKEFNDRNGWHAVYVRDDA